MFFMTLSFKKIWWFIWESNSIWSWVLDFLLAFIFIKFIFFPLLAVIFSASLPMVIVESNSMVHQGNFDQWWSNYGAWYDNNNITKAQFKEWGFTNGINKGDIIIVHGQKNYQKGDIIIFRTPLQTTPIIHRVVFDLGNGFLSTKGDNNQYQLSVEKEIRKDQIVGKAIGKIPWLGWIKLFAVNPASALG